MFFGVETRSQRVKRGPTIYIFILKKSKSCAVDGEVIFNTS